jgi:Fuc2NAc and GlcNAc transferase
VFCVFFLAAAASWILLRALLPSLRLSLLDQPNYRSSHIQPTPSGGGVVFVLISSTVSSLELIIGLVSGFQPLSQSAAAAPLVALPLSFVGFLDDRFHLPASLRYVVQFFTALLVILPSPLVPRTLELFPFFVLLLFVVTAVINFINFMDGLDGLVAGCMSVVFAVTIVHFTAASSIWALVGALLGFLFWNWSPAKVFMGDVGSTFLGAVFTYLIFQSISWPEAFSLLLLATPLLADPFFCVIRRLIAGQPVFQAHRLHLYQRLHLAGWSHARVSILYISATVLLALSFVYGDLLWLVTFATFELFIGFLLDLKVATPFQVASRI